MSRLLQGILESNIRPAVQRFGTSEYTGPDDAARAQEQFITDLSAAIARSVQQYLNSNVIVLPGQATAGGPTNQVTVSPGGLAAP